MRPPKETLLNKIKIFTSLLKKRWRPYRAFELRLFALMDGLHPSLRDGAPSGLDFSEILKGTKINDGQAL